MATIIPGFYSNKTPPGEIMIFNYLKDAPADWLVFHSLDLTAYNNYRSTEIDFVVVIPDLGILCIEVKSHPNISFDGKKWEPSHGLSPIKYSPFTQSIDARYAFWRRLNDIGISLSRIPVCEAVMFPCSTFELSNDSLYYDSWNFYDSRRISNLVDRDLFYKEIKTGLQKSINENRDNFKPLTSPISKATLEYLISICAPIQKHKLNNIEEIKIRELDATSKLRDQQKSALRKLFDFKTNDLLNPRTLIKGPAGTGKTWIALEIAKRMADRGFRVGLFSYNKNIGEWMSTEISKDKLRPNLIVGSINKILCEMFKINIPKDDIDNYWNGKFYDDIEDSMTDSLNLSVAEFDFIVIDEVQDFLSNERLWSLVSSLIKGGLINGSYCLLGDLDYQLFGSRNSLEHSLKVLINDAKVSQSQLLENCRNYKCVADAATSLSGLGNSVYDSFRRSGGGFDDFSIRPYIDSVSQSELLYSTIQKYLSKGYTNDDIVILSFNADSTSCASTFKSLKSKLKPIWKHDSNGISYCTVNAFKGMEAKIVVLTDVQLDNSEFRRNQLYTAITRATESIIILCDESSKSYLLNTLTK